MVKICLLPSFHYQTPFILYTCIFSYNKFMDMAAKVELNTEDLPLTERAALQHSLHVHQQQLYGKR